MGALKFVSSAAAPAAGCEILPPHKCLTGVNRPSCNNKQTARRLGELSVLQNTRKCKLNGPLTGTHQSTLGRQLLASANL